MSAHRVKLQGFALFTEPQHQGNHQPEVRWKHPGAAFENAWGTKAIPVAVRQVRAITGPEDLFTRARIKDPGTSKAAARKLDLRRTQLVILGAFQQHGDMTDEALVDLGLMSPSGARSRRAELVVLGKLRDTGRKDKLRTGNEAIVWGLA